MDLERLGNEKIKVERGAARSVRSKDPTNKLGRLPKPKEIAPSSRKGRTTKYALNICISKIQPLFVYLSKKKKDVYEEKFID